MATRLVFCLLLTLTLPGCQWFVTNRPMNSQDSIYKSDDRPRDPALWSPHLALGAPGQAESPWQEPPAGKPLRVNTQPDRTYPSIDPANTNQLVRAWIDGYPPTEAIGGRTVRIRQPISRQPRLKFELEAALGQFRGAAIQIYRVVRDQPDIPSGIRLAEDVEYSVLAPGKEIDLAQLKGATCRRLATGETVKRFELDLATEYEVHFLVSGSRKASSLAVRVRTAAPATAAGPASRPAGEGSTGSPGSPDEVDPSHLPSGVTIPKQPR